MPPLTRTSSSPAPGSSWRSGTASGTPATARTSSPVSPTSQRALATLLDMTATHVPVLAGELIDLVDPQPGATVVDCTFGGGGHARLIADRIAGEGTLIGIDRDPIAGERFVEL